MAKHKKAKGSILPKRIAGVKVPKQIRRSSRSLTQLLESPAGREVVAGALVAVAGSLVGSERVRHAVAHEGGALAGGAARAGAGIAGAALGGVADAVLDKVLGGKSEGKKGKAGGSRTAKADADNDAWPIQGQADTDPAGTTRMESRSGEVS